MARILIGAGAAAVGAVVAISFSDIRRYLKMRSM